VVLAAAHTPPLGASSADFGKVDFGTAGRSKSAGLEHLISQRGKS